MSARNVTESEVDEAIANIWRFKSICDENLILLKTIREKVILLDKIMHEELSDEDYVAPSDPIIPLLDSLYTKMETYFSSPDTHRGEKIMLNAESHFVAEAKPSTVESP